MFFTLSVILRYAPRKVTGVSAPAVNSRSASPHTATLAIGSADALADAEAAVASGVPVTVGTCSEAVGYSSAAGELRIRASCAAFDSGFEQDVQVVIKATRMTPSTIARRRQ